MKFVIDGQQRLTSLLLLVNGWKLSRGGKKIDIHALTANPSKQQPELYVDAGERRGVDLYRGIRDRFYTDTTGLTGLPPQRGLARGGVLNSL